MDALLAGLKPLFAPAFALWGAPVTWLEVVAFALALATVLMNIRVNPLGWPLAIVSSLLYFGLFWDSRLYGDASLQIFFAVVALWGWWQWLRGTQADGRPLECAASARADAGSRWPCSRSRGRPPASFLRTFTDTDVPWWDAFPTAASVVGQWLLGRKYIENWPTWLVVNVVSVALFAHKGLWLTVVLYTVFIVLSVVGWKAWIDIARTQRR
jgi:nicotinamide mononucleotide transporter